MVAVSLYFLLENKGPFIHLSLKLRISCDSCCFKLVSFIQLRTIKQTECVQELNE